MLCYTIIYYSSTHILTWSTLRSTQVRAFDDRAFDNVYATKIRSSSCVKNKDTCTVVKTRLLVYLGYPWGVKPPSTPYTRSSKPGLRARQATSSHPSFARGKKREGAKYRTSEINTSETIVDFQWHFPMDFRWHVPTDFHVPSGCY